MCHRWLVPQGRLLWIVIVTALLIAGCGTSDHGAQPEGLPFEGQQLRLAVIDDAAIADAVRLLLPEWQAQTGAVVEVVELPARAVDEVLAPEADAVIYAAPYLGVMAHREWIAPLDASTLASEQLRYADVFELTRTAETTWADQTMALPLGSPQLVCYLRADLLRKFKLEPPETWADYQRLVTFFANRANLADAAPAADERWFATAEPLAPGWAGIMLLARAAAYARHPENYSTLFSIDTMEPLIAGPPFVRALEELVAANADVPDALERTPDDCRRAFWQGHCAMAITWPTAAVDPLDGAATPAGIEVDFVLLPGAAEVYDISTARWDERDPTDCGHVPLIAFAGRVASLLAESEHRDAAAQLMVALVAPDWSARISPHSPHTTLFRHSHAERPRAWVEPPMSADAAARYGRVMRDAGSEYIWLDAVRLTGRERYLAALDKAVAATLGGERSLAEALAAAVERWRQINDELGVDVQRTTYRGGLGLPP